MEIRLHDGVGEDEDVPEWALRYNAKEYPRHAVTGDAVALALEGRGDHPGLDALVVTRAKDPFAGLDAWPGGFLDWMEDDDTHQAAVRELREETGMAPPEYVEALGSYSRNGRDPRQFAGYRTKGGEWVARGARVTTNAFLMLMRKEGGAAPAGADDASEARWASVYAYLPWEDLRDGAGRDAAQAALEALCRWAGEGGDRRERIDYAWGFGLKEWNEERVPERYALLLEAGLVPEGRRDRWGRSRGGESHGREMAFDHRQMLADALGRLRGKIKYLPAALVALAGDELTLDELQGACEAIAGRPLHRANFRRTVAPPAGGARQPRTPRIVAGTGRRKARGAGEPGVAPELFRFRPDAVRARLDTSLRLPWLPVVPA